MSKNTLALISESAPEYINKRLKNDGFEVLRLPSSPRLALSVRTHTDMLVFPINDTVFCHESYASANTRELDVIRGFGYSVRAIGGEYESEYPRDVRFNIARVGRNIMVGKRTQSAEIGEYALKNGFRILYVSQGYAKCSSCIVGDNALITADSDIARVAGDSGISVLRISEGGVRLEGYQYGFIGGASGCFGDTVYFVGDVKKHSDGERIIDFCQKNGMSVSFDENEELIDIGSILFLPKL